MARCAVNKYNSIAFCRSLVAVSYFEGHFTRESCGKILLGPLANVVLLNVILGDKGPLASMGFAGIVWIVLC